MLTVAARPVRRGPVQRIWSCAKRATATWQRMRPGHHARVSLTALGSHDAYHEHLASHALEYQTRQQMLNAMSHEHRPIITAGDCICCRRSTRFRTDPAAQGVAAGETPNWREGLLCEHCAMNSRTRAIVHLLQEVVRPDRGARVYLTEQLSSLHRWASRRYPRLTASEFLRDGTPFGKMNPQGVRCEDLTDLSFASDSFQVIVSLEVMEHIPDFRRAFAECARVLAPGGKLVLCVPFHRKAHHVQRATLRQDGSIEHLLPQEYHGDPLNPQGCLCFHHFGWDILDFLKQSGFCQANAYSIWSAELGYVASEGDLIGFIAEK